MNNQQGRNWCITVPNFTPDQEAHLRILAQQVPYVIFGRETAPSGLRHLQCFIRFPSNQRFLAVKALTFGVSAHYEVARGTCQQAADYCKKDGDFEEFGSLPAPVGKSNQSSRFRDWILDCPTKPTLKMVGDEWPSIFLHNKNNAMALIDVLYPAPITVEGEYRAYQNNLATILAGEPDPRKVIFIVDPVGNTGKTWFIAKYLSTHDDGQRLTSGKIDDLAFVVDDSKRVFLFDIPRSGLLGLQYRVLEALKDKCIFSNKYESRMKHLAVVPHVVVFTNEEPDRTLLSLDRYQVIQWRSL